VLRDTEAGLTFMPVVEFIDGSDWLTVKVSADGMLTTPREVKLSPTVIRRAVASPDVSPLTLLACALAVPNGDLGSGWRPKRVGGALPLPQRLLEEQGNLFRWIDSAQRIGAALNELKDVLITGDHGSGKTCMAAHFARQHEEQRGGLIWLDLSDPADGAESILATLLSTEISKQYLLVVDGMQANITVIESVLSCVTRLRSVFQITIQVLATGWGSVAERLPESFRHMVPFNVQGADLIDVYLAEESLANDVRKQLRELAKGDIHIAATALALHKRLARVPDRRDLQVEYTRGVDDDGMRHALYWCACLAFFEIDVSRSTAERKFGKALERLQSSGRIQFSDSSLTVGPRARAALILRHAHHEWEADTKWGRPRDITWQYLRSHDDLLIKAMLGRLDLSSQSDGFRPGTRYLLTAWDLLGQLQRQLERDCEQNPTRNDLVGNAAFTAIALARLGSRERWADVVDKLRDRWVYDGSAELPRTQDGTDSSDFVHFTRIRAEMLAEDEQLRGAPYLVNQPGDAIDLPRFYRTWVLGLLLGVEGRAPVPDPDRTRKLHAIAAAAQDPVGFFYPRRVPWNTARVILGLVAAGFDYNNDEVVRRACQWLLRPVHDGGAFSDDDGYWHSGTGTWNTDEATTAMCLTALAQAGAPRSPVREMAYAWLADGEKRWTARGREIDLAHVLEALLHGPDDPAAPPLDGPRRACPSDARRAGGHPPDPVRDRPARLDRLEHGLPRVHQAPGGPDRHRLRPRADAARLRHRRRAPSGAAGAEREPPDQLPPHGRPARPVAGCRRAAAADAHRGHQVTGAGAGTYAEHDLGAREAGAIAAESGVRPAPDRSGGRGDAACRPARAQRARSPGLRRCLAGTTRAG
jgi:hypothetical protein